MDKFEKGIRKRVSTKTHEYTQNAHIDMFLQDIEATCVYWGLSIAHQDEQGAFIIEKMDKKNIEWLHEAHDGTE